jgi:hypothetical protein
VPRRSSFPSLISNGGSAEFSVTIPEDLDGCTEAGECAISWWWTRNAGSPQTYTACVDFVVA